MRRVAEMRDEAAVLGKWAAHTNPAKTHVWRIEPCAALLAITSP